MKAWIKVLAEEKGEGLVETSYRFEVEKGCFGNDICVVFKREAAVVNNSMVADVWRGRDWRW